MKKMLKIILTIIFSILGSPFVLFSSILIGVIVAIGWIWEIVEEAF